MTKTTAMQRDAMHDAKIEAMPISAAKKAAMDAKADAKLGVKDRDTWTDGTPGKHGHMRHLGGKG